MRSPSILLGDQLETAIRLCTQSMGLLYGFKGRRLDDDAVARRSLLELNLLTTPFLYYLSRSGLKISKQIVDVLVDSFTVYRSASGSFDNTKFNSFRAKGDLLDTALSVISLIKIDQIGLTNHQKDILEAIDWLLQNTALLKSKNEIHLDSLISCYTILLAAGLYEDKNLVKAVVEKLQPLRFVQNIQSITALNPHIDEEVVFPFGIRILIEIANLSGHEHFYKLAFESLDVSMKEYEGLFKFLNEGKTTLFKSKKINIGAVSLWAYNYLQLYAYNQTPELLELGSILLRLVSDLIIESSNNIDHSIPKYFSLRKGDYSEENSISYMRYFLDAAELGKEFISSSVSVKVLENYNQSTPKGIRFEI